MSSIYQRLVELKGRALRGCVRAPYSGICRNAGCAGFSETQCKYWPDFSGDPEYPVPHPELKPDDAYDRASKLEAQFDLSTSYGNKRMEYLDFLIHRAQVLGV